MKHHTPDWFIDRIGQRIYRLTNTKCCTRCDNVYANGLIIYDKDHAEWLYCWQSEDGAIYADRKPEVT
jgi:hypothetical protein